MTPWDTYRYLNWFFKERLFTLKKKYLIHIFILVTIFFKLEVTPERHCLGSIFSCIKLHAGYKASAVVKKITPCIHLRFPWLYRAIFWVKYNLIKRNWFAWFRFPDFVIFQWSMYIYVCLGHNYARACSDWSKFCHRDSQTFLLLS